MRGLHLSDIHFTYGLSSELLHEKLLVTLSELCKKNPIDELFITGDFRHARHQDDTDEVAYEAVDRILKIADAAYVKGIPHIHIIPGNHDVQFYANDTGGKEEERIRIDAICSAYGLPTCVIPSQDLNWLLGRLSFYKRVSNLLYSVTGTTPIWSTDMLPLHPYKCFDTYSVLYLNTVFNTDDRKEGSGGRRSQLILGMNDLRASLAGIHKKNPGKLIIILAHHSAEFLRYDERKQLENLFRQYTDTEFLYLCGDAHQTWVRRYNNISELTMGCLHQNEKDVQAAFAFLNFGNGVLMDVEAYRWDTSYQGWDRYGIFESEIQERLGLRPFQTEVVIPEPVKDCFVGRDTLKDTVIEKLFNYKMPVMLSGIPGVGKTEVCRALFENLKDNTQIIWLTYQGNVSTTLLEGFKNELPQHDKETMDDYLLRAVAYTHGKGHKRLLIIDGADTLLPETDIPLLKRLGCRILLSSRIQQAESFDVVPVELLSMADCLKIYRHYSKDETSPNEMLEQILSLAGSNTMVVHLLAKIQRASHRSSAEIRELLDQTEFDLSKIIPEVIQYSHNPEKYPNQKIMADFNEQLSKLVDVSALTTEEFTLLKELAILAPEPIPLKKVKEWFELPSYNVVNTLQNKGWLRFSGDNHSVEMHAALSSAVRFTGLPTEQEFIRLLTYFKKDLAHRKSEYFPQGLIYLRHIEKACSFCPLDSTEYANVMHNMALVFINKGEYAKAMEWLRKDLAITEKVMGREHLNTAITYNSIAGVYDNQGDSAKALEWNQKAVAIYEKMQHPDIVEIYNNIGFMYNKLGNYTRAMEWNQKALAICERAFRREDSNTATTYHNIALVYDNQGQYTTALKWSQKAVDIYERILGKEHPGTAGIYNDIAAIHSKQGEYATALEWFQKALSILEKTLGKEHPDTALTYHNIAAVYYSQGKYEKSLEWNQKALVIRENALGKTHPYTAGSYNNIAAIYLSQGEYAKALQMFEKALAIKEKALGKEHPNTVATYNNIINLFIQNGHNAKAAEMVCKRVPSTEQAAMADYYCNIAEEYNDNRNYTEAILWYQTALDIYQNLFGKWHQRTVYARKKISNIKIKIDRL